jgi:Winged helix DNA-binding domain
VTQIITSADQLVAERCATQLLSGAPAARPVDVVRRLLAVQGQDPRGVRLAIRARTAGMTAADVDRAMTVDRSLLITWLNRGTLHLVTAEDYWWLHPLTSPLLETAIARRLTQEGVSEDDAVRAVRVIDGALADGPRTRNQLAEVIGSAGIRTEGQALVHLLARASVRGLIVRGPMISGQHAFVRVSDWLGAPPERFKPAHFARDSALAELARRYLAGHGPAGERDLAKWAGLPLRDVRRGLNAISGELRPRADGLVQLAGNEPDAGPATIVSEGRSRRRTGADPELPPPRLLGSFDPLLHGWVDREPVLGDATGIITVNGLFRPFALVNGRAAATWTLSGGEVNLTPFAPLPGPVSAALDADAQDVIRFLGSPAGG